MGGSNTVALVMYLVFYIFLILLFILWMYSIICRCYQFPRFSGDRNTVMRPAIVLFTTNQQLPRGLEESVIETFPKFSFMDTDMDIGTEIKMTGECVVCLGMYQENETLRLLPKCGHVFHADCVDIWLRSHGTCPFCRANLLANGEPVPDEIPRGQEIRVNVIDTRNSDMVVP